LRYAATPLVTASISLLLVGARLLVRGIVQMVALA
jgi:hypothetical protein